MIKANEANATANASESFTRIITEARLSHARSKEAAADAVGNAYMLWLVTESDNATKSSRDWIEKEITLANQKIKDHNDTVNVQRDRVTKFMEGALSIDDAVNEKPRNAAHAAEIELMRQELREQSQWDRQQWARRRRVMIEARDGASTFTRFVKYVFQFSEVQHSDQVAKYSLVLEWIHGQFADSPPMEKDQVVAAIKDFGSFEDVLFEQRRIKTGEVDDGDDRKIMSDAIRADIKNALTTINPIATIAHDARYEKDGFVMFLGRKSGGQVSLVSELEMSDADLQSALSSVGSNINIPNPQNSEFVARVLELGKLVSEGQEINRTHGNTKSGEKIRVQRIVALRPHGEDGSEFVISARSADASPIIYARPKNVEDLGRPDRTMMLTLQTRKRMEHFLRDANVRRHIEIKADTNPKRADSSEAKSPMSWIGDNVTLLAQSSKNAQQQFYWSDMLNVDQKPLDVENFQAQFEASIDDVELDALFEKSLKAWAAAKSPVKASMVATLKFQNENLLARMGEAEELGLKLGKSCGGKFTLSFRMREFHDLVVALLRQHTSDFTIRGDEGGLLEISWEDGLGSYWVYLPTVNQDGKLQSRRVAPMRLIALMAAE